MKSLINHLLKNPKQIFLIDALGALMTCTLLLVIQTKLNSYFGMPPKTLFILAIIAFIFFAYSISCFFLFTSINWKRFLKIIATANVIYCGLTFVLLISNFSITTPIDWIYFLGEISLVSSLVAVEIRLAKG
jgi:hypothetical protein